MIRPRFGYGYSMEPVDGIGTFLISEDSHRVLTGRLNCLVAPLIDGLRSEGQIADALEGRASRAEVYYALADMEQKGYLVEAWDGGPPEAAAFWEAAGASAGCAAERLSEARVQVHTVGQVPERAGATLVDRLAELGVDCRLMSGTEKLVDHPGLSIVLSDDYLRPELAQRNREALDSGLPWMLVRPFGTTILFGPLFSPGQAGCWECLAQRLRANRPVEGLILTRTGRAGPLETPKGALPATVQMAIDVTATEAAKWIALAGESQLAGKIRSLDTIRLETEEHILVRRPQCPACGSGASDKGDPAPRLVLQPRRKQFTADGGHRPATPEATYRRYRHHVSPYTGIVTALRRVSSDDAPDSVYLAAQNYGQTNDDLGVLRASLRNGSAGKGVTDEQARASGLCEALERYSSAFQGDEPRHTATLAELGASAVHPNACGLHSAQQYLDRGAWRDGHGPFHHVPEPFEESAAVEWTPLWSLTNETVKYVPTAYCYFGYGRHPAVRAAGLPGDFAVSDSNGNAAGATLEDAVLQGFLELAERDAVGIWWFSRTPRPTVELASFDVPYFQAMVRRHCEQGRRLFVLDVTNDLGIPSFVAVSHLVETVNGSNRIVMGCGAHLDPTVGISRALTEVSQVSGVYESWGGDSNQRLEVDPDIARWSTTAIVERYPHLAPAPDLATRRAVDYAALASEDLRDDVYLCVRQAAALGLETLVLDLTRADVELPVVKVIVPGLRHFWARFAPGRLYDVPVKLGWRERALTEAELDPTVAFF